MKKLFLRNTKPGDSAGVGVVPPSNNLEVIKGSGLVFELKNEGKWSDGICPQTKLHIKGKLIKTETK